MDAQRVIRSDSSPRDWLVWSALLLAIYLAISFVSWRRTLIGTEVWALYNAGKPFGEQLQAIRTDLVHPPLMYLLERCWLGTFGQTDRAAKTLALLINLPTFFLFPWLARRITPHWRLASFFFLAIYFRVGSTPNLVRMYGLGFLLTVAAMVLWEKWCEAPRNPTLIVWSLIALLLIYTHLFGALLLLGFWVANWLCGPRRGAFTVAAAVPALSFLPWLLYVLPVYESRGLAANVAWVPKRFPIALAWLQYGLLGEFPGRSIPVRVVFAVLAGLVHLLFLYSAWNLLRRNWPPRPGLSVAGRWFWAALFLAGIPVVMIVLFSIVVIPSLASRFILGVLPAYWLLTVLVWQESGRLGRIMLYGIVLPWVVAVPVVAFAKLDIPSPPRQAAILLAREERPSDLVLCGDLCNGLFWELNHHFGATARMELLGSGPLSWLAVPPERYDPESPEAKSANRLWLFVHSGKEAVSFTDEFSHRGFVLQRKILLENFTLLLMSRPNAP